MNFDRQKIRNRNCLQLEQTRMPYRDALLKKMKNANLKLQKRPPEIVVLNSCKILHI